MQTHMQTDRHADRQRDRCEMMVWLDESKTLTAVFWSRWTKRTLTLEDVSELTDSPQQLSVGHRQLFSRLVTFPKTNNNTCSSLNQFLTKTWKRIKITAYFCFSGSVTCKYFTDKSVKYLLVSLTVWSSVKSSQQQLACRLTNLSTCFSTQLQVIFCSSYVLLFTLTLGGCNLCPFLLYGNAAGTLISLREPAQRDQEKFYLSIYLSIYQLIH